MNSRLIFALALCTALPATAQVSQQPIRVMATAPVGACSVTDPLMLVTNQGTWQCVANVWTKTGPSAGGGSLSGMTAGQVPIAATATTVTSSKPVSAGTRITTNTGTVVSGDFAKFIGTDGQLTDGGSNVSISAGGTGVTTGLTVLPAANVTGVLAVANGGSGTATPSLVAGAGITLTGTWPNQTVAITPTSAVTFAALPAAGAGASTPVCTAGYACDYSKGTVSVTTGTAPAAGDWISITRGGFPAAFASCLSTPTAAGGLPAYAYSTGTVTSILGVLTGGAPVAATTYSFNYRCN